MNDFKDDLTALCPVKKYKSPKLPTLQDARDNPALLKKLPSRWENNAKVIGLLAIISAGAITLSACAGGGINPWPNSDARNGAPVYSGHPAGQEPSINAPRYVDPQELELIGHIGGAASGPFYVVYITEQEALDIIRAQLEAAGLNFDTDPPGYVATLSFDDFRPWSIDVGLDLYDAEKGVAVAQVGQRSAGFAEMVAEEFAEQKTSRNITVGVFYNPYLSPDSEFGTSWDWGGYWSDEEDEWIDTKPSDEEIADAKEKARPILESGLNVQVQEFIAWLQAEGII